LIWAAAKNTIRSSSGSRSRRRASSCEPGLKTRVSIPVGMCRIAKRPSSGLARTSRSIQCDGTTSVSRERS
jgi:hypothetical protein